MNILLIVKYFPPNTGGGRSFRSAKLVKYFSRSGCRIAVICSDISIDRDDSLLAGTEMEKVGIFRCREPSEKAHTLYSKMLRQLFVADGNYVFAFRLLNSVLKTQIGFIPDVILSSSAPYEVHCVGMLLRYYFKIPWIADFRDPYTLNYNYCKRMPSGRFFDRRFEKRIYDTADGIIFNTNHNKYESIKYFNLSSQDPRLFVCQNGYDSDDIPQMKTTTDKKQFIITYIGGVRGDKIESSFVSAVLQNIAWLKANNVCFRFIGNGSEFFRQQSEQSDGVLETIGFCSQSQLKRYWEESDALLLMLPHASSYLGWVPQKLYSYLGTGLPILALVPNGEARDYLKGSQQHVIAEPDESDIPSMISALRSRVADENSHSEHIQFDQKRLFGDLLRWMQLIAAR